MQPVGYVRVSTKVQINGTSLEAQAERVTAYCKFRGLGEPVILQDPAVSTREAPLEQRPGGRTLLQMIDRGEVSVVIITKLDRAFRSASDCLNNVEEWERLGVGLIILDLGGEPIDTRSTAGKFMLTVLAAAAEMERKMINERCQTGREVRRSQGCLLGQVPFGWDVQVEGNLKKLVRNEREQGIIETILALRGNGWTTYAIAKQLNRTGARRKRGGAWSPSKVQRVIDKCFRGEIPT